MQSLVRIHILIFLLGLSGCSGSGSGLGSTSLTSQSPLVVGSGETNGGTVTNFKLTCLEAQFIYLLNIYRKSQGLNALQASKAGVTSARWHAQNMIDLNYFSHTEPSGRQFASRSASFGYSAFGENIAAGNSTAIRTFCQWKLSAGHNANMLGKYQSTGIGRVTGGGVYSVYWSSNFGFAVTDALAEPLTEETSCEIPSQLPTCT